MKTRKLRVGRFVNVLVVQCSWRFRHAPISPTQFDLLRGTVPHRKPSTGNRRLVFSHTSMNGTCGFGITLQRGTTVGIYLEVFADADYASRATDRRSVSGGAIMCAGACVCWFSRTQKCATVSTSEAEYVALGDAVKELLFLRQVWRFMIPGKGMPCFPLFEDNQGALQLSKNPVSTSNSKHIDVRHHFLRELVRHGDIIIVNHVPSEYQHADILTKVLAFDLFAIHRRFLMNLSD